jgi:hypothetical protein
MTENLPARQDQGELVVDTVHDMHPDHRDPQHQEVQQNVFVALMPLAVVVLLILTFALAAWTFLAAQPPGGGAIPG